MDTSEHSPLLSPFPVGGTTDPISIEHVEARISTIFREVLQRETIAAQADFFELGGDSLFLLQIIMRISEELGVDLTIERIGESITVTTMAKSVFEKLQNAGRVEPAGED